MTSYWLDEEPLPRRQRTVEDADVVVVGGGVTGCTAALVLARGGVRVRLHEAREIAGGASGRNGGFALRGGAMPYDVAVARFGRDLARELWRLSERALERLAGLAADSFRPTGSLRLELDADALRREHDALRADGFAVEWREAPLPGFPAALFHPADGALQPARCVRRLASLAADAGAEIREHARVESVAAAGAEHVVIATDGYTHGLVPVLDAAIRPTRGQVLVTEPLPELLFLCPHYARGGFDYWQQTPERRLVIGGRRDRAVETESTAAEETTEVVQRAIEELVRELLGRLPRVTHRWSGIWGGTDDGLPVAGRLPGAANIWVAAGYSGHGNVLGLACGELVARAILGENPRELALFEPARFAAAAA